MVSVNLLSPATIFARRRSSRVRCWATAIACALVLAAVPVGIDVVKTAQGAALERETDPVLAKLKAVRSQHKEVTARCADLTARIARADALRAKRSWAGLLSAVAYHTPSEVWLTSVASTAASAATHRGPAATGGRRDASPIITLEGPIGIRITGYALDHEWLYEFMSALKSTQVFKSVDLTQAGKEPVLQGVAVRFVLACEWQ